MDRAGSVHLVLSSRDVPSSAGGVLGADGVGTHAPAFKGTLDARLAGVQASVDVVSVGHRALPQAPVQQPVRAHRPGDLPRARPGPPVRRRQGGLSSLLTRTTGPKLGDRTRSGSTVLQTVTGSLPGRALAGLLAIGEPDATFTVDLRPDRPGQRAAHRDADRALLPRLDLDLHPDPRPLRRPG